MISTVIFDCDGVLFDSRAANVAYYNAVVNTLGLPPLDAEWEQRVHVLSARQVFDAMFGPGSPLASRARAAGRRVDYAPFYDLMRPAEGLYDILAELKRSYHLAMATNRSATTAGVVRHFRLERFLDLAVGLTDVERPKPFPDMIEKCLRHFGISGCEAIFVGDAESDRQAAQAAGVHFVAAGAASWASARVRELRDLPEWLAEFQRRATATGAAQAAQAREGP